jgi:phosphate butyryltransferase
MNAAVEGHRNRTWDELRPGDEAALERVVTARDLYLFAHASGNLNPMHLPQTDLDGDGISDAVAPSMWIAALVSNVLGNLLPGAGTLMRRQDLRFDARARVGDRLRVSVRLQDKLDRPRARFHVQVHAGAQVVADGTTEVDAPLQPVVTAAAELPALLLDEHDHFAHLIDAAAQLPPMVTAVVCPDDANALGGALLSARRGLVVPLLIGRRTAIEAAAAAAGVGLDGLEIIDEARPEHAAARAVALVHEGRAAAIMKGNLHSDELLAQVVRKDGGLRAGRRISHVFVLDVPTLAHPLFISDAAINIAPDLATKVDIVQNAIDLALACGVDAPRVGLLSAVETVNLGIPSSMDAAILAKMAERGQIRGGIVDGPLAMDNAIDPAAAATKKLASPVAGAGQVLVVPNLEAGNMLAKQLTFVSRAQPAGLVVGAAVPVMLTSRADNDQARLASCALAQLYDHFRRTGQRAPALTPPERRADA